MMAMMANLSQMMAPSMMGMAVGSMVGRMATRAFGQYDLPIPRSDNSLLLVPTTIDRFAGEWEVPLDEMRLWVLAQEMIGHSLFSITSLRDDFAALVRRHVGAFRPDPNAVAEKLSELDVEGGDPMQAVQKALTDPALLLGAVQSKEQAALAPQLDAATAAIVGYVDYCVDAVAARVIGGEALRIAEAVRRRRVEASPDDLYIERLLGLKAHPRSGAARQDVHRRRRRPRRRVGRQRPLRPPRRPADTRRASTPPASGSPASSSDPALRPGIKLELVAQRQRFAERVSSPPGRTRSEPDNLSQRRPDRTSAQPHQPQEHGFEDVTT